MSNHKSLYKAVIGYLDVDGEPSSMEAFVSARTFEKAVDKIKKNISEKESGAFIISVAKTNCTFLY